MGTLYFVFFACYPPSPSAWSQILAMQNCSLPPRIIVVLRTIMYTNQFQLWKSAGCFRWLGGVTPRCGSGLSGGSGLLLAAVVSYCGLHMLNHATLQINRLFNLICHLQFTWSYAILHCWMTFRQHGRWDCFLLSDAISALGCSTTILIYHVGTCYTTLVWLRVWLAAYITHIVTILRWKSPASLVDFWKVNDLELN